MRYRKRGHQAGDGELIAYAALCFGLAVVFGIVGGVSLYLITNTSRPTELSDMMTFLVCSALSLFFTFLGWGYLPRKWVRADDQEVREQ